MLLLARLDSQPRNLKAAVESAVASLQAVLQATMKAAGESAFAKERDAKVIWRFITHLCSRLQGSCMSVLQ